MAAYALREIVCRICYDRPDMERDHPRQEGTGSGIPSHPREAADDTFAREAARARELAGQGHLIRLWGLPPGRGSSLGLWAARDADQMRAITADLPLAAWLSTDITPLTPHPSDPATTRTPEGKGS